MKHDLAAHEQTGVVVFHLSRQAISRQVVRYADPVLITLMGRKQGGGRAYTLPAHQSSIQALDLIE